MRHTYEQAKADHKYLWDIGAAHDMTGGYVDSKDLDRLLEAPTKRTACDVFKEQITYWFQVGPDLNMASLGWADDPIVEEIADRYSCTDDLNELRKKYGIQ